MQKVIKPKIENAEVGFEYAITDEQIKRYALFSDEEKLAWLDDINEFLNATQTKEEKEYIKKFKNKYPINL
ncbi:MAG: hypothetical protein SFY32_15660 [Bacteroidota bacterium]|nr:hypothetical protein [Bacteroidota bacterium]